MHQSLTVRGLITWSGAKVQDRGMILHGGDGTGDLLALDRSGEGCP